VTAHAGTIIDLLGGPFARTPAGNVSPAIAGYLKEIPGYADFFGHQSFCNCKHCQSILGPAAYFVDLMCFVDETTHAAFFTAAPNHTLSLRTRRPDLWTLDLTCENTNTPIPYLVIINEILENAVARDAGFAGNFADRAAVGRAVYRDTLPGRVGQLPPAAQPAVRRTAHVSAALPAQPRRRRRGRPRDRRSPGPRFGLRFPRRTSR
jgi:hypothetical protein